GTLSSASQVRADPPVAKDIKVVVADHALSLMGEKLTFPGELEPLVKLLGKPSRVVDHVFRFHVWDDFGVAAKESTNRKDKTTVGLQVTFKSTGEEENPKKFFAGKLVVEGKAIDGDTDLGALGKPFEQDIGSIWEVPSKKATIAFATGNKMGQGVKMFLFERSFER